MRKLLAVGPALCLAMALAFTAAPAAAEDDPAVIADTTPTRVLSVVSGGYWEASVDKPAQDQKPDESGDAAATREGDSKAIEAAEKQDLRGYYRSVAIRSADNTSRLYLQRIWLSEDGPALLDTREITALTELQAYITDMRPENSTGIASQQGFVTFVYLKLDPKAQEPDTWELYVDEFGDTAFTPASN